MRASTVQNPAVAKYGPYVDFGPCIIGRNLNLLTVRGNGGLDELALISGPDIFDQELNPQGTQRPLDKKHTQECYEYAIESVDLDPHKEPRAFPEILLNARDASVVEFYDTEEPTKLYDFASASDDFDVPKSVIGVRVPLSRLIFPKPDFSPQISRIDGNHRLSGMDQNLADLDPSDDQEPGLEAPIVPFSLFVGLVPIQEVRLFNTVNEQHKGMEPALIDAQKSELIPEDEQRSNPAHLPRYLARQLSEQGGAFAGMIFFGGSIQGVKKMGLKLPLRINTLKTTVSIQLGSGGPFARKLMGDPDFLFRLVNNYWLAVRETFPEAWNNKREFILLQTIGLNAFAMFWGRIIEDAIKSGSEVKDFKHYLNPMVRNNLSLARDDYSGVAGAGGARRVFDILTEKSSDLDVTIAKAKARVQSTA